MSNVEAGKDGYLEYKSGEKLEIFFTLPPLTGAELQALEEEQSEIDMLHEMRNDPNFLTGGTVSHPQPVSAYAQKKFLVQRIDIYPLIPEPELIFSHEYISSSEEFTQTAGDHTKFFVPKE